MGKETDRQRLARKFGGVPDSVQTATVRNQPQEKCVPDNMDTDTIDRYKHSEWIMIPPIIILNVPTMHKVANQPSKHAVKQRRLVIDGFEDTLPLRAPCSPEVQDFATETRPLESWKIIAWYRPSGRGGQVRGLEAQNRIGINE